MSKGNILGFWRYFRSFFIISFLVPIIPIFMYSENKILSGIGMMTFAFTILLIFGIYFGEIDKINKLLSKKSISDESIVGFSLKNIGNVSLKNKQPRWYFPASVFTAFIIATLSVTTGVLVLM